jgi:arylsulfatase
VNQPVSRRAFVRTAALSSAALAITPKFLAQSNVSGKQNLLVFLPDQLRADTITGGLAPSVHAPNLHKFASQSVTFERAYVTQPICAPSRSSLLSGTWPHTNGCIDNKSALSLKFRCLPEILGDPDYRTGYFGKWHLGDEYTAQRGFQEWTSTEEYQKSAKGDQKVKGQSDYAKFLMSKGYKAQPDKTQTFGRNFVSSLPFELSKPKFLESKACDFLQRHRGEPFVLFVAFYEPHPPYNGPFNNEHPLDGISLDPSVGDTFGDDMPLRYRLEQQRFKKRIPTIDKYRQIRQKYFGLVNEIDRCIGTILRNSTIWDWPRKPSLC